MKLLSTCRIINKTLNLIHKLSQNGKRVTHIHHELPARATSSWTATTNSKINKKVYVSSSLDIFENLALEEWLYENVEMVGTDYLLMWRNRGAVVAGRHQNPWMECDVQKALENGISVVRRNSGGGTVYHDEGNLNLSFLMHRSRYDRRRNLSLVVNAVTSQWDIDLDLNCRDDLVLDGVYKVSGTASKLGRDRTYHHFTLVFDVHKDTLSSILHSPLVGVSSKATKSTPSLVKNLAEDASDVTFDLLVKVIGQHFLEGDESKDFAVIDPMDESRFPGVTNIQHRLRSWEWIFGKTPPFSITRTFVKTTKDSSDPYSEYILRTDMSIEKGKLHSISLTLSGRLWDSGEDVDLQFRLLDLIDLVGERLESKGLRGLWERCWRRLREEEGWEDYELLRWGLECLVKCVPVGYGDV